MSKEKWRYTRREVREQQDYVCALCGERFPPGEQEAHISVHHKIPKSKGGPDTPENAVGLCRGEGSNNCHDLVDYLTLEHAIPYEVVLEEGVVYDLADYELPRHLQSKFQGFGA